MDETLAATVRAWIEDDPEAETRAELEALLEAGDEADLAERFRGRLQFGTAGLRGLMGGGPNRMNQATIVRMTAGLVAYALEACRGVPEAPVVIGFDARRTSRGLATAAAEVLLGAGFRVALFEQPAPTPMVVFASNELQAPAALVVTASHNPPEYNGCKVYWMGSQIVPPVDAKIAAAIDAVPSVRSVARTDLSSPRHTAIGADLRDAYTQYAADIRLDVLAKPVELRIAYTAMHGVGGDVVVDALARAGFEDVSVVASQQAPDGTFPTVAFPNPEEDGAMDLVLALAAEKRAHLVLANDPDADRLAMSILHDGRYVNLTGDQIGCLLAHYALTARPWSRTDRKPLVLSSIVSTAMLGAIGAHTGVRAEQTLTGHKWIHARAKALDAEGYELVLGYEEALGYAVGPVIRDKDGISAAVFAAEMAAWCAERGRTIVDELESAWRTYGMYLNKQVSWVLPGTDGAAQIQAAMERARTAPPATLAGLSVVATTDLRAGTRTANGDTTAADLPPANLVIFELDGGHRVMLRPSGTEPKLKQYFDLRVEVAEDETIDVARARGDALLERLASDLASAIRPKA